MLSNNRARALSLSLSNYKLMCQHVSGETDSTGAAIIPDLVCARKVCREIRYGADNEEVIDKFGFRLRVLP
jgi:hypothetical protein